MEGLDGVRIYNYIMRISHANLLIRNSTDISHENTSTKLLLEVIDIGSLGNSIVFHVTYNDDLLRLNTSTTSLRQRHLWPQTLPALHSQCLGCDTYDCLCTVSMVSGLVYLGSKHLSSIWQRQDETCRATKGSIVRVTVESGGISDWKRPRVDFWYETVWDSICKAMDSFAWADLLSMKQMRLDVQCYVNFRKNNT